MLSSVLGTEDPKKCKTPFLLYKNSEASKEGKTCKYLQYNMVNRNKMKMQFLTMSCIL